MVRKLARDAPHTTIYCAPGNPGTAQHGINVPIPAVDVSALVRFATAEGIALTIVGPEQPLAAGLADAFALSGLPIFGPCASAARLESSKAFSKRLMQECGVATAAFEVFEHPDAARTFAAELDAPLVVKASGLAGGKGAVVCANHREADEAIIDLMERATLGDAGAEVVIEEFMAGEELSVFFITDGVEAAALAPARDHKRRMAGDLGPNTGGMGAYSPVLGADPELIERIRREIAEPVLAGLADRGAPYRGFLYAGIMLTPEGPKVVEFNCRLGDPEAQVVLPLMEDELLEPLLAVGRGGGLGGWRPEPPTRAALTTVVVQGAYPGPVSAGLPIVVPADLESAQLHVYHAGTALENGRLVTAGGRVFGVTGIADDLVTAAERSRSGAARIQFEQADWRPDIGHSEIR
jgi:phosphoribosylamine--glycine ligase